MSEGPDEVKTWLSGIQMAIMYKREQRKNHRYIAWISGIIGTTSFIDAWAMPGWVMLPLAMVLAAQCLFFARQARKLTPHIKAMEAYLGYAVKGATLAAEGKYEGSAQEHLEEQSEAARKLIMKTLKQ